jgi:hypothetical protein
MLDREPRKCTKCRRPCVGHIGPTGPHCSLTPVPEWDLSFQEEESPKAATSESGEITFVHRKLDALTDQFAKLMSTVGCLSEKIDHSLKSEEVKSEAVKPVVKPVVEKPVVETLGVKAVQAASEGSLPSPSWKSGNRGASGEVTTQSLARDVELSRLLDTYNSEGSADLLKAQDAVNSSLSVPAVYQGEVKQKKPLLIPDFITSCRGLGREEDDIELLTSKGPSFKLQGRAKRPEAKDVSVAQWITANTAILERLLPSLSARELKSYLFYTRQIGNYLQIYTAESCFLLDNEHRKEVCLGNCQWHEVCQHMVGFYLVRRSNSGGNSGPVSSNSSASSATGSKSKKSRFSHPCARFNSPEGCSNDNCKFQPICSVKGCRGPHPKHEHPSADFRKGEAASSVGS